MHYSVRGVAISVMPPIVCTVVAISHFNNASCPDVCSDLLAAKKKKRKREIIWRIFSKKSVKARLYDGSEDYFSLFS